MGYLLAGMEEKDVILGFIDKRAVLCIVMRGKNGRDRAMCYCVTFIAALSFCNI